MSENIATALRVFLLADVGVNTLVGTRVFVVELPRSEAALMPRQCVVIRPSGESSPRRCSANRRWRSRNPDEGASALESAAGSSCERIE